MQEPHASSPASRFDFASRVRAAAVHLLCSAGVAALAATLVFALWYPMPYREISGGRELFLLVVTIDVILGPLITFAVFDRRKPRAELVRDLGVVVLLQLAALAYGLYTVAEARPAVVALEGSRLRVVRTIDLEQADLSQAPDGLRSLSWSGPLLVAARAPTSAEKLETIQRGLAGEDIGMRPAFWRPESERAAAFAQAALPLDALAKRHPAQAPDLQRQVEAAGRKLDQVGYLPILARSTDWSALVDRRDGAIIGYAAIDGF